MRAPVPIEVRKIGELPKTVIALLLLIGIGALPAATAGGALPREAVCAPLQLALIPPSPVSDAIQVEIRAGIANRAETAAAFDVAFYLDRVGADALLHRERLDVPPAGAGVVSFRWPTEGMTGAHRILCVAAGPAGELRAEAPLTILATGEPSTGRLGGAWVDLYHHDEEEGRPFNAELGRMTDEDWRHLVRAMHAADTDILVVTMLFQNFTHVGQHTIERDGYHGRAYYPSALYPERMPVASEDALETILCEADRLGMHVLPGIGCYAFFDFTPASLQWHKEIASEVWERYGHHPSFYGWYVSDEIAGNLGTDDRRRQELVDFFREFRAHVRALAPEKPVMLATNAHGIRNAGSYYPKLLPHLDILCPFGFHRMPEGDLSGEAAAATLQRLCDEAGCHLWMDMETFVFRNGVELHPRPIEDLIGDLRRFPGFERILHYQFPGLMSSPAMPRRPGGDAAVQLYLQYMQYLEQQESILDHEPASLGSESSRQLVFSCDAANDLYRALRGGEVRLSRHDDPATALREAPAGSGVLILAGGYPETGTVIPAEMLQQAQKKDLRLYIEYPTSVSALEVGPPRRADAERLVVASDFFGPELPSGRILAMHGLHFVTVSAPEVHIVAARVAGFDTAVFGLPAERRPILCELEGGRVLVAATRLSQFVTGRYAPAEAWRALWSGVLNWLLRCEPGEEGPVLIWTPVVRPAYGPDKLLPRDAEAAALRRGADWFLNSQLLLHPSRSAQVDAAAAHCGGRIPVPPPGSPHGDGSLGILEGMVSIIQPDGGQLQSAARRGDCTGESAMALALAGTVERDPEKIAIARNLLDFWYFTSPARQGERADPHHGAYGLLAWGITTPAWYAANYGDDNARALLGTLAVAGLTGDDRWDEPVMMCLLANLRTTGALGFRGSRIDLDELAKEGWATFFRREIVNLAPHYEAYLWACFLWAYGQTGDRIFLDRTENAIRMTMTAGPSAWHWTNGLAQERARMLLPMAWLVRVRDTPEHRTWLRQAVEGVAGLQVPCGAIREELGTPGLGDYPPPASNQAYGTNEASLIQQDGDPVCDLLYTVNFAFLGLHEAATAGDELAARAEDRLAEFLCRIQVLGEMRPELDGAWFRAFDFQRWEHWGSNADAGWGAWAVESGWTQGWITAVLALRQMKTSLWDLTQASRIERHFERLRREMLPDPLSLPAAP